MLRKFLTHKDEEGFTLIELLVVIVIIGILAAIALPIFLNQQRAAMHASVKSDLRNLNTAIQTFSATNGGKIPQTCADFTKATAALATTNGNVVRYTKRADGGYFLRAAISAEVDSRPEERMFYRSDTGKMYSDRAALTASFTPELNESTYLSDVAKYVDYYTEYGPRNCTL